MNGFRVAVGKERLIFAAGHFITYGDGECEPLHGHNYRAGVSVSGDLDDHALVLDFVALQREMEKILGELDHRMLLPTANPHLRVSQLDGEVEVVHADRRYVFPRRDVVQLPVPNTTAEMLAAWIGGRLTERLAERGVRGVCEIEVEVEESIGQSAFCRVVASP